MKVEILLQWWNRRPFIPIEMRTSSGTKYVASHPEAFAVHEPAVFAMTEDGVPTLLDPASIESVQALRRRSARSDGNARRKK